jgi:hypothetical protein
MIIKKILNYLQYYSCRWECHKCKQLVFTDYRHCLYCLNLVGYFPIVYNPKFCVSPIPALAAGRVVAAAGLDHCARKGEEGGGRWGQEDQMVAETPEEREPEGDSDTTSNLSGPPALAPATHTPSLTHSLTHLPYQGAVAALQLCTVEG